ncbi:MAG TPA: HEAT repeat domain-containing protein, partial [Kofleriaceae bacterium]|nr:HEAT repeat domain-containing protein [Kofleriaceae bacterium]
ALIAGALHDNRDAQPHARFGWSPGAQYTYDLAWHTRQSTPILELGNTAPMTSGELDLAGTMTLRSYGLHDGATVLGARFGKLGRHRLVVLGKDLLPDDEIVAKELGDAEVFLEVLPDGHIRSLAAAVGTRPLARNLVSWIASELEVVIAGGDDWSVEQTDPFGRGVTRYEIHDDRSIDRTRASYAKLDALPAEIARSATPAAIQSHGTITIAAPGHLQSLVDDETIAMTMIGGEPAFTAEAHVVITLRSIEGGAAPRLPELARMTTFAAGERVDGDGVDQQLLEKRIAGLTADRLVSDLRLLDGPLPGGDVWLWQASGLLVLHPDLCATLVAPFGDGTLGPRAQGIVLDLLAAAGHAQAQATMRTLVASAAAKIDPARHAMFVQRFTFLHAPDPDSVAFIRHLRATARVGGDVNTERAATYALGAMTGALARSNGGGAAGLEAELLQDLSTANAPADRVALLEAVGNAHLADTVPAVMEHISDTDAGVRRAVVVALSATDTNQAHAAILELAGDSDSIVQRAALTALRDNGLDAAGRAHLGELVASGTLTRDNDAALVTLVAARVRAG